MQIEALASELKTDLERGLSARERERRLKDGPNLLAKARDSAWRVFLSQFADTMVLMLLAATLVSAVLGEFADALTITVIVVLNALLGFAQEFKAERSLEALRELAAPTATIVCQGTVQVVPAAELVNGDIVFLKAGDRVPADVRVFGSANLEVDESPFTGESQPVAKEDEESPLAFMGCLVTRGKSKGLVVATGMRTKMGSIARLLEKTEQQPTPLQKRLSKLGNVLVLSCLGVCVIVVLAGVLRGEPVYRMFMAGVSLAVAAIPEGLPAVVTLCLAFGLQRMLKRNAITRKLPAVETLGCATAICSDKTGTLTQNRMTVEKVFTGNSLYDLTALDYSRESPWGQAPSPLSWLFIAGAVCNGASLQQGGGRLKIIGDPTDGALLIAAAKGGFEPEALRQRFGIKQEFPFESRRKMMSVVARDAWTGADYAFVKGAPEVILPRCRYIQGRWNTKVDFVAGQQIGVARICRQWAEQAYRLLAVAWKECGSGAATADQVESDLIFSGIIALSDPPRRKVPEAISRCRRAGIKTMMITGDHRETAVAIARRIGLAVGPDAVLTGDELESLSDEELAAKVDSLSICARVYPEHKLRIVRALKKRGHVVAMTGDGVNDAPAVKEADIGIAMGIAGTEVTKEAAGLILADDNFATITAAVEEGRVIYSNIRKFIRFLLTCNTGEVFTMLFAILLGLPLPLRAIQILWINLVTDGLPALALSLEPGGPWIMEQPPRARTESIMARGLGADILSIGVFIGAVTVAVFALALRASGSLAYGQTMALATLISIQLLFALDCRHNDEGSTPSIAANPWLAWALVVSYALLSLVLYWPVLRQVFGTVSLTFRDWAIVLAVSLLPLAVRKVFRRLSR